jgi:hypothetical protein
MVTGDRCQDWGRPEWGLTLRVQARDQPGVLCPCPSLPSPVPLPFTSLKQVQHLQKHRREQGWILMFTFPVFLALAA